MLIGAVVAGGLGVAFASQQTTDRRGVALLAFGLVVLPVASALGWALLVDRATIAGTVRRPEDSVEHVWLTRAAAGAFGDLFALLGLGAAAISVAGLDLAAHTLLIGPALLALADVAVRYWWQRRARD